MMTTGVLASCRYSDCEAGIGVENVTKVTAIPKAPHHIALIAVCTGCNRAGQYVVERSVIEDAGGVFPSQGPSKEELALRAAAIELDAVDTADDLIALWSSLPAPPFIDGHAGKCVCGVCRRKRYA